MNWFIKAISGPIGQKILMALSGLFLISFLVVHLIGNFMLMFRDPGPFNAFVDFMETNPIIQVMEYGLFAGFFLHIIYGVVVTLKNRKARPVKYSMNAGAENSTWFSRNMGLTGSVIFFFLVVHLRQLFIPQKLLHSDPRSFHDISIEVFSNPAYVILYVVSMFFLAFHLNHGFQSAFQTLGLRHKKYTPWIQAAGLAFAVVVPFLFALIPVVVFFR
jgi:succinate dehydrogenase / fumarate reductase cytochrome b subunit